MSRIGFFFFREIYIYTVSRNKRGRIGMRGVIVFERRTIVFLASGVIKSRELGEQV